jgi:hypothetical protein
MKLKILILIILFILNSLFSQNLRISENVEVIKDVVYGEVDGKKFWWKGG